MTNHVEDAPTAKGGDATQPAWFLVVGQGRSGSTLLGNVLTDTLSGFHCGELQGLWEGISRERLCTCGVRLARCELWASVLALICDEMGFQSIDEGIAASRRRTRQRHLLAPRPAGPSTEELALRSATEKAVEKVTGSTILIDSSKVPPMMWTAAHLERPLTIIHLIRDPRGVANSWSKPTPDPSQKTGYMGTKNVWQSSMAWNIINLTTSRVVRRIPNATSIPMRYEDFANNPANELARVVASALDVPHASAEGGADARDNLAHAIGGNPRRFRQEEIKLDRRWLSEMPLRSRLTCTALTTPLLRRYNYPLHPRHHDTDTA